MVTQGIMDFGDPDPESRLHRAALEFHAKNPHVWEMFKRYSLEAARANRGKFGARLIWERMRWYMRFETTDKDYKLNDHHPPYYARWFMEQHPEYAGFFETRKVQCC